MLKFYQTFSELCRTYDGTMVVGGTVGYPASNSSDQCQTQCRDFGPVCTFFSFDGKNCYMKKDQGNCIFDPKVTSGPVNCPPP